MPNDNTLNSKLPLWNQRRLDSARASRWPWWVVFGAFAVLFMLVYSAAILIPYAFMDDYIELAYGLRGNLWQQNLPLFAQGRAAQAILNQATWGIMHGISDARLLRMFGIIGLGLLAYLLYRALVSARASRAASLLIPVLICVMPAYQVYVSWADCAVFTWGASLAGFAALVAEHAVRSKRWRSRLSFVILATVLEYIALTIYQPAAMVYWVFVAIRLLMSFESVGRILWRMALMGSVVVLGLGGDFLTSSLASKLLFGSTGLVRTRLATNPVDKISWFAHGALTDALNLYSLQSTTSVAILVFVVSITGLLLYVQGTVSRRAVVLSCCLLLLPLSYIPNLLVAEDWSSYRTQSGIGSLVALYVAYALLGILQSRSIHHLAAPTALAATAVVGMLMAAYNVTTAVAIPQRVEYMIMASQLQPSAVDKATNIYIIPPTYADSLGTSERYDEFGLPSSIVPWSAPNMVYLILRSDDPAKADMTAVLGADSNKAPAGSLVVDMRQMGMYTGTLTADSNVPVYLARLIWLASIALVLILVWRLVRSVAAATRRSNASSNTVYEPDGFDLIETLKRPAIQVGVTETRAVDNRSRLATALAPVSLTEQDDDAFWDALTAGLTALHNANFWMAQQQLTAVVESVLTPRAQSSGLSLSVPWTAEERDNFARELAARSIPHLSEENSASATDYVVGHYQAAAEMYSQLRTKLVGQPSSMSVPERRYLAQAQSFRTYPILQTRDTITWQHISIVLPAYNEQEVIGDTVENCLQAVRTYCPNAEVIVVDDGSRDRTGAIADELARHNAGVVAVHNRPNRGYGGALRSGFDAARGDIVFFMDSDGQFDIHEIRQLLIEERRVPGAVVLGYRAKRNDPFMRKLNAAGWKRAARFVVGLKGIRDIDCAFKLMPSVPLRRCAIQAEGASINVEFLAKLQRQQIPIIQLPVTHRPRTKGSPTGANLKVIMRAFKELFRLRQHLRTWTPVDIQVDAHMQMEPVLSTANNH